MTWIKTIPLAEADEKLREAWEGERALYPIEYAQPTGRHGRGRRASSRSHSLIPDALYHAFATFGVADVARPAADPAAARDDHDGRLGDQPLPLLNRVSRRVSASGDSGRRTWSRRSGATTGRRRSTSATASCWTTSPS